MFVWSANCCSWSWCNGTLAYEAHDAGKLSMGSGPCMRQLGIYVYVNSLPTYLVEGTKVGIICLMFLFCSSYTVSIPWPQNVSITHPLPEDARTRCQNITCEYPEFIINFIFSFCRAPSSQAFMNICYLFTLLRER